MITRVRPSVARFQIDLVNEDMAVTMTGRRLLDAKGDDFVSRIGDPKGKGADCMVTPCPLCHINVDSYQAIAEKRLSRKINLPVFTSLNSLGWPSANEKDLGLTRNMVSRRASYRGIFLLEPSIFPAISSIIQCPKSRLTRCPLFRGKINLNFPRFHRHI